MKPQHVVVDGSNIATEGRTLPSLSQLDEAVRAFIEEFPGHEVIVVVDATFGHRIDDQERKAFEEAELAGELVSPPAGAIGRGDAFLLRIADKVGAIVFSNDSFQEFHGEYDWLFDKGRLIGGKPVQGIGWIFTDRAPVRGPKSREAVKEARRQKSGSDGGGTRPRGRRDKKVDKAIEAATEEAVEGVEPRDDETGGAKRRRRTRGPAGPPSEPVNEPLAFITFVDNHKQGTDVEGEVERFSSHGAFVVVDGASCYIPLSAMGSPPPRAAREVLKQGETRTFVVQSFDSARRGIELALPGFAKVAGAPTEETVEAEMAEATPRKSGGSKKSGGRKQAARRPSKAIAPSDVTPFGADPVPAEPEIGREVPVDAVAVKQTMGDQLAEIRKATKKTAKQAAKKTAKVTPKKATATKKAKPVKAPVQKVVAPEPVKGRAAKKVTAKKVAKVKKVTPKPAATKKAAPPAKKAAKQSAKKAAKQSAPTKKTATKKK
ncbi:MAG: hypothetical protein QOG03_1284 [Actinomycetota bacterium]|jgi:hypothetical protein|nr:hypothetical protein [Actinomycetota bacterium]